MGASREKKSLLDLLNYGIKDTQKIVGGAGQRPEEVQGDGTAGPGGIGMPWGWCLDFGCCYYCT